MWPSVSTFPLHLLGRYRSTSDPSLLPHKNLLSFSSFWRTTFFQVFWTLRYVIVLKRPPLSSHLLSLWGPWWSTKVGLSSAEAVLALPNLLYVCPQACSTLTDSASLCKSETWFFTVPKAIFKKFASFVTCHSSGNYIASIVNTSTRTFCSFLQQCWLQL